MRMWTTRTAAVAAPDYSVDQVDLREAYDRGRRDERQSRHHHPIIAVAVVILALIGAWMLYLAAREGSFTQAGPVADANIQTAVAETGPALRQTGEAIKDAGATLKDKAETAADKATSEPVPASDPAKR